MIVVVLLAGAVGALFRDEVIAIVHHRLRRPALRAVAVVNLTGALALGTIVGAGVDGTALVVLGTGLLGSFTTYSTWMVESALAGHQRGALNVAVQFVAGALAVAVGLVIGGLA